jgi:hypothetical protein
MVVAQGVSLTWYSRQFRIPPSCSTIGSSTRRGTSSCFGPATDNAGLDFVPEPPLIQTWVTHAAAQFPDWVARYGTRRGWDFSAESLDDLARVVLDHCPADPSLVDDPDGDVFVGGMVCHLGETLHCA